MNNEEILNEQEIIEKSGGITAVGDGNRFHCMSIIGQIIQTLGW